MKHARPRRFAISRGFTLIETVMVVVVLGIAGVAIVTMQGNLFRGQSDNKDILVGVQLMQECAENLLAIRKFSTLGYADPSLSGSTDAIASANATAKCAVTMTGFPAPVPLAPTVTIISGSSATSGWNLWCPSVSAGSCKLVQVRQGSLASSITLALVQ